MCGFFCLPRYIFVTLNTPLHKNLIKNHLKFVIFVQVRELDIVLKNLLFTQQKLTREHLEKVLYSWGPSPPGSGDQLPKDYASGGAVFSSPPPPPNFRVTLPWIYVFLFFLSFDGPFCERKSRYRNRLWLLSRDHSALWWEIFCSE